MKSNVIAIMKKELARFFGDKRLMLSAVLLPGILIYLVYSLMGSALTGMLETEEDYRYTLSTVNFPQSVSALTRDLKADITAIDAAEIAAAKAAVAEKTLDLLAIFPEDFDAQVAAYDPASGETAPRVALYYNAARTESAAAYNLMTGVLNTFESALANKFDINPGDEDFDLATDKDASGFIFSSLLPMLLMVLLFSGCMAVAPEAIAGEKERGTIATILITPVKRSELVMGKIFALAVVALFSGASSILGTLLSLPKLMGGASESMSAVFYGPADYLMLAAVVLSTVLVLISMISIISAYAKTIKEAQTSVMPLMIIVMLVGMTGMFSGGAQAAAPYYFIPLYNSVQSMVGIFSFNVSASHVLVTVLVNLALSAAFGFVLTRMFNSEKIMFNK
ncbi:MAG: ABC transporter permease subunit [Oscillospiraceae bacterium]|jgi:sodium transport system permease protein|nr:ABC transporter permease subunit [Oscillospiraceae bacterium]